MPIGILAAGAEAALLLIPIWGLSTEIAMAALKGGHGKIAISAGDHRDQPIMPLRASIPRRVHQLVLGDPRHHGAEFGTDVLDCAGIVHAPRGLEAGGNGFPFLHPSASELARLDIGEHPPHLGLGLVRDDAGARHIFAPLGGVGDRIVHVGNAALVDQIDDQLHLVQAFEIGLLRRIAGIDQRLGAGPDELDQAAASAAFAPAAARGAWRKAPRCWWTRCFPNSLCTNGY